MQHKLAHFLKAQLAMGRLVILSDTHLLNTRIQQQQKSLERLLLKSNHYLNQYDQLFRHMNLLLLAQRYDLNDHQPHQVLKSFLIVFFPEMDIQHVIQQRHDLKKGLTRSVDPVAQQSLDLMYWQLPKILQAYKTVV